MSRFLDGKEKMQLQAIICYVKNLIASLAAEHPEKQVNIRRFLPVLKRVLPIKMQGLEAFFQPEGKNFVRQLVYMMAECGEILHLGNGHYIVPPPRRVILPASGQAIALSLLQEPTRDPPGLVGQLSHAPLPSIQLEDWAYAEKPEDNLRRYEKELYENPEFQPYQWFYVSSKGFRKVSDPTTFRANPNTTYLVTQRPFKHSDKEDWYIGRKSSKGWRIAKIDRDHRQRIIFGLAIRHGKQFDYCLSHFDEQHLELKLSWSIPKEERNMLALIGLPESWPHPQHYLIPMEYVDDAKAVLKRLQMKEEG